MLDKGEVIEEGDHHALVSKNGTYAEMWRMQAKAQVTTYEGQKGCAGEGEGGRKWVEGVLFKRHYSRRMTSVGLLRS